MHLNEFKKIYKDELFNSVMPFWLKNGVDYENGGYYTGLDREGKIFNDEKSVWFQGRMLYILSNLLNTFGDNEEIKKAADCGFEFIKKCFLKDGRMPFIVTREGIPLQTRRYYFSETFAVIALSEYYKYTKNEEALKLAVDTYELALKLYKGEIKTEPKFNTDVLKSKSFAAPMIMLNVASILRSNVPDNKDKYTKDIDLFLKDIDDCIHPECKCCFENVALNGDRLPGARGRLVNPGHSIEGAWFMMNEAEERNDDKLMAKAIDLLNWSFELGWDKEYKGIQYFYDIEGKPLEQLEWDMRLWWPHCEALIAFIKAYRITKDEKYLEKFKLVHEYTFSHFRDEEYGEWYGYLRKDGSVNNTLKGSMFKGPFHIPRCLITVISEIEKIEKGN